MGFIDIKLSIEQFEKELAIMPFKGPFSQKGFPFKPQIRFKLRYTSALLN
jgi:hypothetical protein